MLDLSVPAIKAALHRGAHGYVIGRSADPHVARAQCRPPVSRYAALSMRATGMACGHARR